MSKVLEVTIKKVDDAGKVITIKLTGEDAEKWGESIDGLCTFIYAHGQEFPSLNWETINEPV